MLRSVHFELFSVHHTVTEKVVSVFEQFRAPLQQMEVLKKSKRTHGKIYWVNEPDKGIYHAMNKGIKVAKVLSVFKFWRLSY
jgi:hypothetical protein